MGKSAPKTPDPFATAQIQSQYNQQTAAQQQAMNMIDQYNPWGSVTYNQTGTQSIVGPFGQIIQVPRYSQTTSYTPEQQKIFDQSNRAQSAMAETAANQAEFLREYMGNHGADTSGAPELAVPELQKEIGGTFTNDPGANYNETFNQQLGPDYRTSYAGADDFSADRQRVEDALIARMNPSLQQDEARLRSQLINQGIRPGSAAWDSEMRRLSSNTNDARMSAILGAGNEQSRLANLARDAAIFGNQSTLGRASFEAQQQQAQNAAALERAGFNNQASATSAGFSNTAAAQQAQMQNAARAQAIAEAYQARNQPLNEIAALLSGSQLQNPGQMSPASPQTGVGGVDYSGLVNNNYNNRMQNYRSQMDGISRIAAAPFSMFNFGRGGN